MISVVVPVFNEEKNVALLHQRILESLQKLNEDFEIIFVDDGSRDATLERLKTLHPITIVRFRKNFGQTAGIDAGLHAAKGDIVITLDGDLQNDPADIPLFIAKIREGFDVVASWRQNRQDSKSRLLFSRFANWLTWKIGGLRLHDHGCSFKAYRKEILQDVHLYGEMHVFLAVYLYHRGARVTEIPITHAAREHGESKTNLIRAMKANADILTIRLLARLVRPMVFFGGIGLTSFGCALVSIIIGSILFAIHTISTSGFIWLLALTIFFLSFGFLLFVLGFLFELLARIYFETREITPYTIREIIRQ
ncbi:MAG TPA: glycosyltransferase family 2 protein [Patescibacteria group bacterium]|nr:glycosyltransferase family 2 protein [Patescibacteria group bacterium]